MANTHKAKLDQIRAAKKVYQSPNIVSYGNIRELTQSVGNMSKVGDGATGKTNKTA